MKPLIAGLALLLATLRLCAQTTVTDSFGSVSGYWQADVPANGGAFAVSSGALNFTHGGVAGGTTSSVSRNWAASLSAATDWSARVDLTLNNSPIAAQITTWKFVAGVVNATPQDYLSVEIVHSYMQTPYRIINSTTYAGGSSANFDQIGSITSPTISLLFTYTAATRTLTLGYDGDNNTASDNFTTLSTVTAGSTWLVNAGNSFGLQLSATDTANAMAAGALTSGLIYADNFSVTSTAIPEPSAIATLFGTLALLTALGRRRALNNATMR